eukprot:3677631-Pleurochrysis_carterae.AAC.4
MPGVQRIYCDQGAFGASSTKTIHFIATKDLATALSPTFDKRFCSHHPSCRHASVVEAPPGADGTYKARAMHAQTTL